MSTPAGALPLEGLVDIVLRELSPDLLTEAWREQRGEEAHPLTGYCYVVSEALYYLLGGERSGWEVYRCRLQTGGTHWWLQSPEGHVLDATSAQFDSPLDYGNGRRTGFLSQTPSRRARLLIERVEHALKFE